MATAPDEGSASADSHEKTAEAELSGTSTVSTSRPSGGQDWGQLRLLERLGSGAFGEVYRAWDTQLDREVALKLLHADIKDPELALAEGRMLARVRHPNVLAVFGAARHAGRVGLWMEFVKGRNLSELLREQGPFGAREAALIGIDVCRALAAVHAVGLVHRDVKAQNVMREAGGRILLTDFGAGLDGARPELPAGEVSGTPLYMAPEAFGGAASPATDLYSLGVLLFHLASGAYPVEGSSLTTLLDSHRAGKRRRLRDVRPDLPEDFIRVVEAAIAPLPGERFESAGALEAALARVVGGGEFAAGSKPSNVPGWRLWAGLAAVVGGVVLALAIVRLSSQPGRSGSVDPVAATQAGSRAVPDAAGFAVDARLLRRRDDAVEPLTPGSALRLDDRLFLEFGSSRPAYVYLVNEDEAGHAYLLFPLPGARRNPLPAGRAQRLPGIVDGVERDWTVTSAGGRERLLLVASPERLEELEQELERLPKPKAGQLATPLEPSFAARLRGIGGLSDAERASGAGQIRRLSTTLQQGAPGQVVWVQVFEFTNPS